jgi:diguanylate cyclase (GGDEF)-like protein/PAS domain S-box-containing protein
MNKKAERLGNQLQLFHEIVESMAEGVFLIRARDGVIIYANPAMERIFGYASRELAGKHISAVNAPTDKSPEEVAQEITQSLKDNGVWQGEVKNLKKDGTAFLCHANVSTFQHLQQGNVWISIHQDITERKRAEETIRRRNEELSLLNTINQAANRSESLESIIRLIAKETTRIFNSLGITIHLLSPDRQRLVMQGPFLSPGMVEGIEKLIGISIPRIEHDLQAAHPYRRVWESGKLQVVYGSKGIQEIMAAYLVSIPVKDKLRARLKRFIPAIVKLLGYRSVLIVPLISEGKVIGVVDMGRREPFTEEDVKWLETIAGQLTVVIERKQAEEALRESEQRLASIYDTVGDVIFYLAVEPDEQYRFTSVNKAFYRVTGLSTKQVLGRQVSEVIPEPSLSMVLGKYRQAIEEKTIVRWEETSDYPTGRLIGVVSIAPASDEAGHCTHLVGSVHDITERKRAEEALRDSEEKFRKAFTISPDSININRLQDGMYVTINNGFTQIMGYTPEECIGKTSIELNIWDSQEDRQALVESLTKRGEVTNLEARFRAKNGDIKYGLMSAVVLEPNGIKHILSITHDITERKRAEIALKESEAKHSSMISNVSDVIGIIGVDGFMKYKSPNIEKWFGWQPQDLVGTDGWLTVHPDDLDRIQKEFFTLLEKDNSATKVEYRIRCKDGSYKPIALTATNLINDPIINGVLLNYHDITERKQAEEELKEINKRLEDQLGEIKILQGYLREQAIRDPLTGLFNRLYLYTTMERELARAKRENSPISVMMIDIDLFKDLNDTHGHQAGDEVLKALGGLLRNGIRQGDIACRYGGEEFLIIMPGVDEADAERRAEAIRRDFNNLRVHYEGAELFATISMGIAFYPGHGKDINEIIKASDAAMYKAKQAGRNRVHVWKNP